MKIYLISIPHQSKSQIYEFEDKQDVIDIAWKEEWDYLRENYSDDIDKITFEDAKDAISYDWNGSIWIENKEDLKYYLKVYKYGAGHQGIRILALLRDVGARIAEELVSEKLLKSYYN